MRCHPLLVTCVLLVRLQLLGCRGLVGAALLLNMTTYVTAVELDKNRHLMWTMTVELVVISFSVRMQTVSALFFTCCVRSDTRPGEKETE